MSLAIFAVIFFNPFIIPFLELGFKTFALLLAALPFFFIAGIAFRLSLGFDGLTGGSLFGLLLLRFLLIRNLLFALSFLGGFSHTFLYIYLSLNGLLLLCLKRR